MWECKGGRNLPLSVAASQAINKVPVLAQAEGGHEICENCKRRTMCNRDEAEARFKYVCLFLNLFFSERQDRLHALTPAVCRPPTSNVMNPHGWDGKQEGGGESKTFPAVTRERPQRSSVTLYETSYYGPHLRKHTVR